MSGKEYIRPFYSFLEGVYQYLKADNSTISEKGKDLLVLDEKNLAKAISDYHKNIESSEKESIDFESAQGEKYVVSSH